MIQKEILEEFYVNQKLTILATSKQIGVSPTLVRKYLKRYGILSRGIRYELTKYSVDHDYFEKINTEEKAYWLGFLYADGCVIKRPATYNTVLTQKDQEMLDLFQKSLSSTYPIREYISKTGFKRKDGSCFSYFRITINSRKIAADLIKLGCIQRKSLVLKFPTEEQVPKELIHHFIRGYFDGDGTIFITKSTRNYEKYTAISHYLSGGFCGNKEFLEGLLKELIFLPDNAHVIHKDSRKITNCYNIQLTSTLRCRLLEDFLYRDATIYMKRKKETFRDYNENYHGLIDRIVRSE